MSSDKDIARFLNERDSLQDDRDAAMLLGDFFAVIEFIKHYVYMLIMISLSKHSLSNLT